MNDAPARRRWPLPSPFILMLLGMGLVMLALVWMISARPKPDFAEPPAGVTSSTRSNSAAYDAASRKADARRLKGPQN